MQNKDTLYWIWLSEALGAGSSAFRRLISLYDTPFDIFRAEENEIDQVPDLTERAKRALCDKSLQRATEILDRCEREGIGVLCYDEDAYPRALREIQKPPMLLYYRGKLPDFNRTLCVGVVGTRSMSAYGMRQAYKMSYELASAGACVVSGMAKGIDGVAAAAALKAGGTTVAVLGCGVDVAYPTHHYNLSQEIARAGVILSEYAPGARPNSYHFPQRNRIISGLSQATVVVEAGIGSGSLITAKDAILQGRDVFAIPANVGSKGADGTNGLLRDGARMALSTEDILAPYQYTYAESLTLEKYEASKSLENIDLSHLAKLGVIELSSDASGEAKMNLNPTSPATKEKKSTQRRASSAKAEKSTKVAKEPKEKREVPNAVPPASPKAIPEATLATLSPVQKTILEAIPDDGTLSTDAIFALEHPHADLMAALTMLEIMGLIQKLPGSLYKKA
jgi:DNA processing protein